MYVFNSYVYPLYIYSLILNNSSILDIEQLSILYCFWFDTKPSK